MKLLLAPLLLLACAFAIVIAVTLVLLRERVYERQHALVRARTVHEDAAHITVEFFKRRVDSTRARNDHRRDELRRATGAAVEAVNRMQRNWRGERL